MNLTKLATSHLKLNKLSMNSNEALFNIIGYLFVEVVMRIKLILIVCLFTFLPLSVNAEDIKIGVKSVFYSKVLKENREYWVSLPKSYKKNGYKKYPTLYLLDAEMHIFFQTFSGMINQMSADASPTIPEMIVVGIVSQERARDSSPTQSLTQYGGTKNSKYTITGGANKFIEFIKNELITTIDLNYNTSDYRVLAGYSFTGLPVLQSLYKTPETFNAYLAIDPSMWWDNKYMLNQLNEFHKTPALDKRRLFVTTSQRVTMVYPKVNYVTEFIENLNKNPKTGLYFDSITFGLEENHHTMPIISFYKGLRSIFDGYMIDDHARFRSAKELKSHFKKVSTKLGTDLYLREDLMNWFGYNRLYSDQFGIDVDRAIEFFKLNTEYYPQSANAWDSLGEAFLVNGENKMALKSYKKSIGLNPQNKNAIDKIKQLERM